MKQSDLVNNMDKVVTLYCKGTGHDCEVSTKILAIRHPEEEKSIAVYNTTIFDIEWECEGMREQTTLVLDERDGSVKILSDMQSGNANEKPIEEYEWTELTAFVFDEDFEN